MHVIDLIVNNSSVFFFKVIIGSHLKILQQPCPPPYISSFPVIHFNIRNNAKDLLLLLFHYSINGLQKQLFIIN